MNARKSKIYRGIAQKLTPGYPNKNYRRHPKHHFIILSPGCTRAVYQDLKIGRMQSHLNPQFAAILQSAKGPTMKDMANALRIKSES